jgi:hypothetical protein
LVRAREQEKRADQTQNEKEPFSHESVQKLESLWNRTGNRIDYKIRF